MTTLDDDVLELVNDHIKKIRHSFLFYRPVAKTHKVNVLKAARKYLTAEITKEQFMNVIRTNNKYAGAFCASYTKKLIEAVLKETPNSGRTKKGYVGGRRG